MPCPHPTAPRPVEGHHPSSPPGATGRRRAMTHRNYRSNTAPGDSQKPPQDAAPTRTAFPAPVSSPPALPLPQYRRPPCAATPPRRDGRSRQSSPATCGSACKRSSHTPAGCRASHGCARAPAPRSRPHPQSCQRTRCTPHHRRRRRPSPARGADRGSDHSAWRARTRSRARASPTRRPRSAAASHQPCQSRF